ncbi:DNA-3-methyladenine glycosylase [Daejeonella lutea]|uniref:Putative 3-methyladenine DNA glycosylase n=1 Tax=Daejeonella lutea TaxID=572036 RepID=A0A1T5AG83_9SPHI|nr:DNA-3-methyladenine glycosylase [Daejeonella lutea]SKB33910.1 DNA-3-methyladenine glycosylase [Daejeonella lutea]
MKNKLPLSFYKQDDVISVARALLGKNLYSLIDGQLTGGIIVETEAYRGPDDRGSHAYNNKRTPRNEMMYSSGGVVYMYICYGIHDMVNIVTGKEGMSHAALIRALEPIEGLDIMRDRRRIYGQDQRLCQGPGALAQALGLNKLHNGTDLQGDVVWITDEGKNFADDEVVASARVGMNFDGPYKTIPWRFSVKGNQFVSRPRM